ncbi:MAG: uroporphyrinogen decarboxylase family protein, partial [Alphaproteobacteria bacterium]
MADHGKLLTTALRGGKTVRPPIWLMRQAGRYLPEYRAVRAQAGSFLEVCYTPDLTVEVTLQPMRRFGLDAAILFSDILVIPDAMGQEVTFIEGEGPRLEPVTGVDGLGRLSVDGVTGYLTPIYESVRRLRAELPAETALIGFAGAPWTVATYMVEGGGSRDYAYTKLWAYGDPDGFARLIDMLVETTTAHLIAQAESGVDAVQLFDSWAGILPEAAFRRWVIEPTARIIGAFRAQCAHVPVIGFPR